MNENYDSASLDFGKETIKLNGSDWDVKTFNRSNGKLKFILKLSKEESLSYKNFMNAAKPAEIDENSFLKTLVFMGIELFNDRLAKAAKKYMEENKESFDLSSFDMDKVIPDIYQEKTPGDVEVM